MTVKDMLGRSGVVTREEALRIMIERFPPQELKIQHLDVSLSLGRVLAHDISSPVDLPGFSRSTMDGYVVRSVDTFGASESLPALLRVTGDIAMGAMPGRAVSKGEAMKISTGGVLPEGADAVIMLEYTQPLEDATIEVVKPVAPLENVIQTGDDIRKGEVMLTRGHRFRPQDIAALAGVGITAVAVFERPRVAIISTGNELVSADKTPGPGQVRDVNSYNLEGLITLAGGAPVKKGIIPDDYARLRRALEDAAGDCRMILMTGGSSVGTADMTAKVIGDLGPPGVLVHGVAVKPGKPLIAGVINTPRGVVPVFGLPGHPAAVSVCFELFVRPALIRLSGEAPLPALEGVSPYRTVKARLARSISSGPGREEHVRVALEKRDDGLWARPIFGASGLVSTLVKAVGTVVVPVNSIGIEGGEEVEVRLF